jgi:hypothetical protein
MLVLGPVLPVAGRGEIAIPDKATTVDTFVTEFGFTGLSTRCKSNLPLIADGLEHLLPPTCGGQRTLEIRGGSFRATAQFSKFVREDSMRFGPSRPASAARRGNGSEIRRLKRITKSLIRRC